MWVFVGKDKSVEIDDDVVREVINFYPEEGLSEQPVFQDAFKNGRIDIKKLKDRCEKIYLPWQLFFLSKDNLDIELERIENCRKDKFSSKLLTKRKGQGEITSKRILDRLIRIQNYILENGKFAINAFCGSLKGRAVSEAANHIADYFEIDFKKFRDKKKADDSLKELISRIQGKNINVSRGVLSNGMLLHHNVVEGDVYRNTCGFAIKDEKIPFIFLPSEINPDDIAYRQIYTLVYLLVAIGLGEFEYFVESDFSYKKIAQDKSDLNIHKITTEFLLPEKVTDGFRGTDITKSHIDDLKNQYKMSPTAVLTTLKIRGLITVQQFDELKPNPFVPSATPKESRFNTTVKISTSVKKFNGEVASLAINGAIKEGVLTSIPAQYLLFGRVNKKGYKEYLQQINV